MSIVRAQLLFHLHSDHPCKKDVGEAVAQVAADAYRETPLHAGLTARAVAATSQIDAVCDCGRRGRCSGGGLMATPKLAPAAARLCL
jgi:hypothetical protein